jgi:regulator of ribonuclease activity A
MALGHVPRKTKKQGLGSVLSSLTLLGAEVSEGDWVYADENGVVISKTEI